MYSMLRGVGGRASLTVLVSCLILEFFAATVYAQELDRTPERLPVPPCGIARSLASGHWAQPLMPPDTAYLETLSDADVLHNVLEIEVSDLDPGTDTCWLVGNDTMTIQSKLPALDEFSFRLWDIYSIDSAYVDGSTPVTVTAASETTRVATLDRTYTFDETFTLTIEYPGNTARAIMPFWNGGIKRLCGNVVFVMNQSVWRVAGAVSSVWVDVRPRRWLRVTG